MTEPIPSPPVVTPGPSSLVGREEPIREILRWVDSGGSPRMLVIGGAPGAGRTAVMSELARRLEADRRFLVIPHFFHRGEPGAQARGFLARAVRRLARDLRTEALPPTEPDGLRLLDLLHRAGSGTARPVFLLDGLDALDGDLPGFTSTLLALAGAGNATWLCSVGPHPHLPALLASPTVEVLWPRGELPPLPAEASRQILEDRLLTSGRPASNEWKSTLIERCEGSPLYVTTAVDQLASGEEVRDLPRGWRRMARGIVDACLAGDPGDEAAGVLAAVVACGGSVPQGLLAEAVKEAGGEVAPRRLDALVGSRLAPLVHVIPAVSSLALRPGFHGAVNDHARVADRVPAMRRLLLDCVVAWAAGRPPWQGPAPVARLLAGEPGEEILARVALDRSIRLTLRSESPGDPESDLGLLDAALRSLASSAAVLPLARVLLAHAQTVASQAGSGPLTLLAEGSLQQAWRACDGIAADSRLPWLLLIAWELEEKGRGSEAEETLALLQRDPTRVGGWRGLLAAVLLSRLGIHRPREGEVPVTSLLDEPSLVALARSLAERGDADEAHGVALEIAHATPRARALSHVAAAMLRAGRDRDAHSLLATAITDLEEGRGSLVLRARGLRDVAVVEVDLPEGRLSALRHLEAARDLAASVDEPSDRWNLMQEIAAAQVAIGGSPAALSTVMALSTPEEREVALFELARSCAEMADLEGARAAVALVPPSSFLHEPARGVLQDALLAHEVKGLLSQGDLAAALAAGRRITRADDRVRGLEACAHALARAGVPRLAFGAAREAGGEAERDPRSGAVCAVAVAHALGGDVEMACEVLREIADDAPRARALCDLAEALLEKDLPGSAKVLEEALACAREILDEARRVEALCHLSVVSRRSGRGQPGLRPDAELDEAWVQAHAMPLGEGRDRALKQVARAAVVNHGFHRALEAAWAIGDRRMRMDVHLSLAEHAGLTGAEVRAAVALGLRILGDTRAERSRALGQLEIVDLQLERDDVAGALHAAMAVGVPEERVRALRKVATAAARRGEAEAALAWRSAFMAVQEIPDDRKRPEAYRELLLAQAEAGDAGTALARSEEIDDEWERERLRVEITRKSALVLAREGGFERAFEAARRIDDLRERLEAEREIAGLLASSGSVEEALRTWRRVVGEAAGLEVQQRIPVVRASALAAAAAGAREEAHSMLLGAVQAARSMEHPWERARALHALSRAQGQAGDVEAALRTTRLIEDEHQRTAASRENAEVLASLRRFAEAVTVVGGFHDEHERKVELRRLAKSQARDGLVDDALLTVDQMGYGDDQDDARVGVAIETARRGDLESAERVLEGIHEAWYLATALREMAAARARAGDKEGAAVGFTRAVDAARRARPYKRAAILRDLATAMDEAGGMGDVSALLAEALALVAGVGDRRTRVEEVRSLLSAALTTGDFDIASKALDLVEGPEVSLLRGRIAVALARRGERTRAAATLESIIHRREVHTVEVARALVEMGDEAGFRLVLPLAAHHLGAACSMIALLARLHPEQAGALARVLA